MKIQNQEFWIEKIKKIEKNKWRVNERLYLYKFLKMVMESIVPHHNDMVCLNEFGNINLLDTFQKMEPLGSTGNLYSDNYKLTMQLNGLDIKVAVKVIPIDHKERLHMYDTRFPVWRELKSLELVTKLVQQRVIPNLPILYSHHICNNCSYNNPQIINKQFKMCVLLINELSDTDLRTWIIDYSNKTPSTDENNRTWNNIFFQIWVVLYTVQSRYQMVHHDLHWGNLLINYIEANAYWIYIIEDIKYYVPSMGIMLKLWDFGKCFSVTHFRYNIDEVDYQNYSSLHRQDVSFGADISKIHHINRWIRDISEISNKAVMSNDTEQMLQTIRQKGKKTPDVLLKKYMRQYMHNRLGTDADESGVACSNINDVQIGDLVIYNSKYMIVANIDIFDVILIPSSLSEDEILTVLYTKIHLCKQPEQNIKKPYEFLKDKCLGTYKI